MHYSTSYERVAVVYYTNVDTNVHVQSHTHIVLKAIFPSKPGLPVFPSLFVPVVPCCTMLLRQAKTLHITHDTIPTAIFSLTVIKIKSKIILRMINK